MKCINCGGDIEKAFNVNEVLTENELKRLPKTCGNICRDCATAILYNVLS